MGIQRSHGAAAQAQAEAIDEVAGEGAHHRAEVEFARTSAHAGLDVVLRHSLHQQQGNAQALVLLQLLDEAVHAGLLLAELHCAVLVPEVILAVAGVGHGLGLCLAAEEGVGNGVEGVVREAGVAHRQQLQLHHDHLGPHIVRRQRPLAVGQLREDLVDMQVLDEVHVALLGNGEAAALHVQRAVREDIKVTAETEVLNVVRAELQVVALLVVHHHGVLDVVAVESHGGAADGAGEGELQQADVVVIDIHILEDLLQGRVDHLTCGQQLVDTRVLLAMDDILLDARVFAEDMLRHGLAHREWHDDLAGVGADFRVGIPVELLALQGVHGRRVHGRAPVVVQGEGDLLIACVLVVVVVL